MDNPRPEAIRGKSLHAMTTEQLEELLRLEQDADREPDVDLIEEILAVLDDRTGAPPVDVDSAWEDFKENYTSGEFLYSTPDETHSAPSRAHKKPWFRLAVAAAILVVIILGISVTASASGVNLWNVIVQWSSETFGLKLDKQSRKTEEWNSELFDIRIAVSQYDADMKLVPFYLPDGYKQVMLLIDDYTILGLFENDTANKKIILQYKKIQTDTGSMFQRDAATSEVYSCGGIEHYISTNMEYYLAAWVNSGWECSISGVSSRQELLRMIDSIYLEE